jgi:translation initiation factor 1
LPSPLASSSRADSTAPAATTTTSARTVRSTGSPGPQPKGDPDSPQRLWKMGKVILQRETAHRGGKTVIVIKDFASHLPVTVIEKIAKRVRSACGCGGTVKDKRIEIQGDNVAKIRAVLEEEGFQVGGVK